MHSGCKDGTNLIGLGIETPETDLHKFECVQRTHGVIADLRRKDCNRLVREVAVAGGLGKCFLPIREFHLKCAAGRLSHFRKSERARESLSLYTRPRDGQQVGNAITVHRDFQRECEAGLWRTPMERRRLFGVGADESTGEPILRRDRAGAHGRKVLLGLVETVLRNRCDLRTHGFGFHLVRFEAYMSLMTLASAQMMIVWRRKCRAAGKDVACVAGRVSGTNWQGRTMRVRVD